MHTCIRSIIREARWSPSFLLFSFFFSFCFIFLLFSSPNQFLRINLIRARKLSRKSRLFYWTESEFFSIPRVSQHFLHSYRIKFNLSLKWGTNFMKMVYYINISILNEFIIQVISYIYSYCKLRYSQNSIELFRGGFEFLPWIWV